MCFIAPFAQLHVCADVQPAVHMLRRGLSTTSVVTWLMLGGLSSGLSDMAMISDMERVGFMFLCAFDSFIADAVLGPDLRAEVVVSGRTDSEVLALVPDYGTRLLDFCFNNLIIPFIKHALIIFFVLAKVHVLIFFHINNLHFSGLFAATAKSRLGKF